VGWFCCRSLLASAVAAFAFLVLSPGAARAGTVLFVVAERPGVEEHGDSFVLPLSDAEDVAHARDLIARGPDAAGAGLVFAQVSAGRDGINRDVLAPGEPLWDWHVSKFEGFGDMGLELVDGWPTFVQADVPGWIANTRRTPDETVGHIGFWNYTVVAELAPATIPIPAAFTTGFIGLCAVVVARRWPGAPWRRH
jgi:hypothetical protein